GVAHLAAGVALSSAVADFARGAVVGARAAVADVALEIDARAIAARQAHLAAERTLALTVAHFACDTRRVACAAVVHIHVERRLAAIGRVHVAVGETTRAAAGGAATDLSGATREPAATTVVRITVWA